MKLSKESHDERVTKAAWPESEKLKAQSKTANIKSPGVYIVGKEVKKLAGSEVRKLFEVGSDD